MRALFVPLYGYFCLIIIVELLIYLSLQQIYAQYKEEDFQVWKVLFERQQQNLPKAASQTYLEGLDKIEFVADRIPDFKRVNPILKDLTGWELVVVPGIVPDYTFFELMSNKRFPATTWLRKMKELDYLEEPDMFHDVFAHVPLLTNQAFVDFLEALSKIGLEYHDNPFAIDILSRVYWYTVEFGLIRESSGTRIYGAGILSSAGETQFCLSEEPPHYDFSVQHIAETGYTKSVFQDRYFVIESYEQLYESIPEVKAVLAELVARNEEAVPA